MNLLKTFVLFFLGVFLVSSVFAQVPEKISCQAVVRNSTGELVTNKTIGLKISILKNSVSAEAEYSETHMPNTNANGLVSVEIGSGSVLIGNFSEIDWAGASYFIKTETDINGGTNYTITGTTQLLSVPFALHSKTAEDISGDVSIQEILDRIEALEAVVNQNGSFTDDRDGNNYSVIKIGNQFWLGENMRYLPSVDPVGEGSDSDPHHYVYGYNGTDVNEAIASENYTTYGALYNWAAAQNACPNGWHLPSHEEWTELTDFLGGDEVAGGKLKEEGLIHWESPNTGATNESGFTAIPAGARAGYGFDFVTKIAYFWTSTEVSTTNAWLRYLYSGYNKVTVFDSAKKLGYSVRCVKN